MVGCIAWVHKIHIFLEMCPTRPATLGFRFKARGKMTIVTVAAKTFARVMNVVRQFEKDYGISLAYDL